MVELVPSGKLPCDHLASDHSRKVMNTLIYRANSSCSRSRASQLVARCIWHSQRRLASTETAAKPPEAGGEFPGIATSKILRTTRDSALKAPGIRWVDGPEGASPDGGRETRKMNMYQAVSMLSSPISVQNWLITAIA